MAQTPPQNLTAVQALLDIMKALRAPVGGCPWDLEQDFKSIVPYTVEEAYEVADAIDNDDMASLKAELGDLLFQVVYHAQMAAEAGAFDFADVVEGIATKLIRRHPHVFGDADINTADEQTYSWEETKAAERAAAGHKSVLDDVPLALPALLRTEKLVKRAERVGFFWEKYSGVVEKIREETEELIVEIEAGDTEKAKQEFGDVMFVMGVLARHLKISPEEALRFSNAKFERRFRWMETTLAKQDRGPQDAPIEELQGLWQQAKQSVG